MSDIPDIEFRGDHIHIDLKPGQELDAQGSEGIWDAIRKLSAEHGTKRVFVEGFVPSGERETADVIAAGQRTAQVPHLWMAFHFENFEKNEKSELFEAIAGSKGVRVKFFSDREHALQWLRNNTPA